MSEYKFCGCWKDKNEPIRLPKFHGQKNTVHDCYLAAKESGNKYFSIQAKQNCWSGNNDYTIDGVSDNCLKPLNDNWKGEDFTNAVYSIGKDSDCIKPYQLPKFKSDISDKYKYCGCWKDTNNPFKLESDNGQKSTINDCYLAANKLGHKYFSFQNGNYCRSGNNKYTIDGLTNNCSKTPNGGWRGGPFSNSIYSIKDKGKCIDFYPPDFDNLPLDNMINDADITTPNNIIINQGFLKTNWYDNKNLQTADIISQFKIKVPAGSNTSKFFIPFPSSVKRNKRNLQLRSFNLKINDSDITTSVNVTILAYSPKWLQINIDKTIGSNSTDIVEMNIYYVFTEYFRACESSDFKDQIIKLKVDCPSHAEGTTVIQTKDKLYEKWCSYKGKCLSNEKSIKQMVDGDCLIKPLTCGGVELENPEKSSKPDNKPDNKLSKIFTKQNIIYGSIALIVLIVVIIIIVTVS